MTTLTTAPERLTEHVADWRAGGGEIDASNRLVRNVALTGLRSRNGYRYREAALREALALYADKPVFLDHAPRSSRPHERSTRDLVGSIVEPRFENDRVRADVRVLDTEAGRTFLELVRSNGPAVGMSHVVLAERSADGEQVERLHDVVCVDAVVFPATTSSFRESTGADEDVPPIESLRTEVHELRRKRDELADRVERLEAERHLVGRTREVDDLLAESGLPEYAADERFRGRLLDARPAERSELIAERRALIAASQHGRRPLSPERRATNGANVDDLLVAALHRAA